MDDCDKILAVAEAPTTLAQSSQLGTLTSFEAWWAFCEQLVRLEGLELFDLDVPKGRSGVLRLFISLPETSSARGDTVQANSTRAQGIEHKHCVGVTKRVLDVLEKRDEMSEEGPENDWTVEVSSPGINRRLTRTKHFLGAVGERVKIAVRPLRHSENDLDADSGQEAARPKGRVLKGRLVDFDGEILRVNDENTQELVEIPLGQVREARVDFLFNE